MLAVIIIQLLCAVKIKCQMETKVVQGHPLAMGSYTHSAFLFMKLPQNKFVCGSSIINQKIMLTAGHCIEDCVNNRCKNASVFIGNTDKYKGTRLPLKGFIMHEQYDRKSVANDIGLVAVQGQIEFGEFVQRVSIVKSPRYFEVAAIAGWGLIDEMQNIHTNYLHYIEQKIWPLEECRKIIHDIPNGSFCGGELHAQQYPSEGDSGSALVADEYIQLGIVSFKRPEISRSVVVYTDVPLFYSWIHLNSRKLHCRSRNQDLF